MVSSDLCPQIVHPAPGFFLHITHGGASHLRNLNYREAENVAFRFFFGNMRWYTVGNYQNVERSFQKFWEVTTENVLSVNMNHTF